MVFLMEPLNAVLSEVVIRAKKEEYFGLQRLKPFEGTSIYAGIQETVAAAGGQAVLSIDGAWDEKPDVAIVVFGEDPYAEFQGDRATVDYIPEDGLELLKSFKQAGIAAVAVFISGRPMWVNPEINASDAFVAAWLPGTEGAGVADVLFAGADGKASQDFSGRLSFSWPATAAQVEINVGDEDYNPLFPYGYGLSYSDSASLPQLSEDPGVSGVIDVSVGLFIGYGDPVGAWNLNLRDQQGNAVITDVRGESPGGNASVMPVDNEIQEDTLVASWTGPASLVVDGQPVDFQRETNGDLVMELVYQVLHTGVGETVVSMGRGKDWRGGLSLGKQFTDKAGAGWQKSHIRLSCFVEAGARMESITEGLVITADAGFKLQLATAQLVANPGDADCGL